MQVEACGTVFVGQRPCDFAAKRHQRRRVLEPPESQPFLGPVLAAACVDHPSTCDGVVVEVYPGHATCFLPQFTNRSAAPHHDPDRRGVSLKQSLEAIAGDMESQPRASFVRTERLHLSQDANPRESSETGVAECWSDAKPVDQGFATGVKALRGDDSRVVTALQEQRPKTGLGRDDRGGEARGSGADDDHVGSRRDGRHFRNQRNMDVIK
jgi:hypothetical protein